ncbi:MAG: ATP-binding cassette domain-containing protein [Planctomycetota bacterium]
MASPNPSVHIAGVDFHYGKGGYRLQLPEVRIESGEKVVIIGASGAGKTTLLQLIAGILAPERGTIQVAGTALDSLSDRDRRLFRLRSVGLVFQEFELVTHLSVEENILLPYLVGAGDRVDAEVRERLSQLTHRAGIAALLPRHPDSLSHGERQRVAICRALITRPPLLLADEPTGNLDPETTNDVLSVLFDQVEQLGTTLVVVTHEHALLERFDRTIDFAQFVARSA